MVPLSTLLEGLAACVRPMGQAMDTQPGAAAEGGAGAPGSHRPADPPIRGLAYDSRRVEPGFLFFAVRGFHTDGHLYIPEALRRGAAGVVHTDSLPPEAERSGSGRPGSTMPGPSSPGPVSIQVDDTQLALSRVAAAFYGHPSREMTVIGVTGTDGKSTTVRLIHQLLERLDERAGFLSTVQMQTGVEPTDNPLRQSTPESLEIQRILRAMRDGGRETAVLEATSHGLSERTHRLADVDFDVAVLTNVTHEHLEFHGSLEQYRSDKANLFRALGRAQAPGGRTQRASGRGARPRFGVVNLDDPNHSLFVESCPRPVFTYSLRDPGADLFADGVTETPAGSTFVLRTAREEAAGELNIPGLFNLENLLAAVLAVSRLLDLPLSRLAPHLAHLRGVQGRMESVDLGQSFRVIVDYAHTPEAFERLFPAVRARTTGRIIAVFGSAGERDTAKRRLQGRVAGEQADIVILADEDPRGEDPAAILEEIAAGCADKRRGVDLFLIADRREAIRKALRAARSGDTVLCLGKGHEKSIIYARESIPWDEVRVTRELLAEVLDG